MNHPMEGDRVRVTQDCTTVHGTEIKGGVAGKFVELSGMRGYWRVRLGSSPRAGTFTISSRYLENLDEPSEAEIQTAIQSIMHRAL